MADAVLRDGQAVQRPEVVEVLDAPGHRRHFQLVLLSRDAANFTGLVLGCIVLGCIEILQENMRFNSSYLVRKED